MMDMPLIYIYSLVAMDKKVFSRISELDRKIVYKVMNKLFNEIDADNRRDNQKAYSALVAQGIKVTSPGPEQIPAWRAIADRSIDELVESGQISNESLGLYKGFLEEFRQQAGGSEPGE
jgi:TRAP-type C4-dicarboxylate transport system substrate-binding protein